MKKLLLILSVFAICITATSFTKPEKKSFDISIDVVKNTDGTHTVNWTGNIDTRVHTIVVSMYYGKKRVMGSLSYGIYVWAHWNPYNGSVEMSGSRTFNLFAYDPHAQWVTVQAYISQFTGPESDQYETSPVVTVQIKK